MKKSEQYRFVLELLWEAEKLETEQLTHSCLERGVVKDEADMQILLKRMEEKHYIAVKTGSLLIRPSPTWTNFIISGM